MKEGKRKVEISQHGKIAYSRWYLRVVEEIVAEVKLPKVDKAEKAATRVDGTIEATAAEVKANHMTSVIITINPVPQATTAVFSFRHP